MPTKPMKFEEALKRLEEIVNQMEQDADLEKSLVLFEEGIKLVRFCSSKLEEAKKLNDKQLQADNYEERIRYRLESREIINREEFVKRFPNGWKPSGKSKT